MRALLTRRRHPVLRIQRRSIMLSTWATLAAGPSLVNYLFGNDTRMANAMDAGELHNKNDDYELQRRERVDSRLSQLRNSRPRTPRYEGNIPLYKHEKLLLFLISGIQSYFHPENGLNIVKLGEATAIAPFLNHLQQIMLQDPTGRRILRDKPFVHTSILHMDKLSKLPENTFGYTFYKWCKRENVGPDTRAPVKYIDDPTHAFIFRRYRQCHDFYHALVDMPIIIEGEITVKALEAANLGVPMAALGTIFAPWRLKHVQRERLFDTYIPWALKSGWNAKPFINVYWEELLEKDVNDLRRELGIKLPPDLRNVRKERASLIKQLKAPYSPKP